MAICLAEKMLLFMVMVNKMRVAWIRNQCRFIAATCFNLVCSYICNELKRE